MFLKLLVLLALAAIVTRLLGCAIGYWRSITVPPEPLFECVFTDIVPDDEIPSVLEKEPLHYLGRLSIDPAFSAAVPQEEACCIFAECQAIAFGRYNPGTIWAFASNTNAAPGRHLESGERIS